MLENANPSICSVIDMIGFNRMIEGNPSSQATNLPGR